LAGQQIIDGRRKRGSILRKAFLGTTTAVLFITCLACNKHDELYQESSQVSATWQAEPHYLRKEGRFKCGDTLSDIFRRENISPATAFEIISAFRRVCNHRLIKPSQKYCILSDSAKTIHSFEYYPELTRTIKVRRDTCGTFHGAVERIPLITKIRTLKGTVQSTLYEAILDLGESPELIAAFSDVFQWDVDFFADPRKGDEFRIIYEANYLQDAARPDSLGELVSYGRILAGQYDLSGAPLTAIYFDNSPQASGYYDLSGKSFQKTFLKSPLNYRRISSYFSGSRMHPILKIVRSHYAVDFAAPTGTPVSAAADGVVIEKGSNSGIGNYVKIRHKNPHFVTVYGHLSRFAEDIQVGSAVKQKDVIGYVGSTGLATGPHLHYAFYENGHPLNPLKIKNTSGDPVLADNMAGFVRVKEEMLSMLGQANGPLLAENHWNMLQLKAHASIFSSPRP